MAIAQFHWTASDNLVIKGFEWPKARAKAVLCLVHGMGEHVNRYDELAQYFNKKDIAVIGFDHRGHGQSDGPRGHVRDYDVLLESVDTLLDEADKRYPDVPKIVYGHSMGGNVACNHALRNKGRVNAYVLSAPWLKLAFDPPAVKLFVGKIMRKLYPRFVEKTKLDATLLSHIPERVKKYQDDPLVHDSASTSFFFSCKEAAEWALENANKLRTPMLIMHGADDKVTSVEGSKEFAQAAKEWVTFKRWDGLYHEIHNEEERFEVFDFSYEWLQQSILK